VTILLSFILFFFRDTFSDLFLMKDKIYIMLEIHEGE